MNRPKSEPWKIISVLEAKREAEKLTREFGLNPNETMEAVKYQINIRGEHGEMIKYVRYWLSMETPPIISEEASKRAVALLLYSLYPNEVTNWIFDERADSSAEL